MPLLRADRITHHFGGLCALSDFSLAVQPGQVVGIIGPNGAGKTTVFNIVTGVHRPGRGRITFEGREISGMAPSRITGLGIARTFQNIRLFRELSVLDNVRAACYGRGGYGPVEALFRLGRFRRDEERIAGKALDLLDAFGLRDWSRERAGNLPYGIQRRVEIARALATGPTLLLLDEPAAGMNPAETGRMAEFIRWIRRSFGLTVVLIDHQMPLVMGICERITVLDFGAVIAEGSPEEIRNDPRVLKAYLGEEEP